VPEGPREQRRKRQLDLSRSQLLDAAEEVFGAKGFHDTTLREIAERAEFSVGSVYSFFESKDDLYLNVMLRRGDEFVPAMSHVVTGEGTATERLHRLVDFQVGFFREHRHFARLYLRTSSTNRPVPDEVEEPSRLTENFLAAMRLQADLFGEGQRSGELRAGDPIALARMFSGLISAYQSIDPAVVTDDDDPPERLSLGELHEIVEGAFCDG